MRRQTLLMLAAVVCAVTSRILAATVGVQSWSLCSVLLIAAFPLWGIGLGVGIMGPFTQKNPRLEWPARLVFLVAGLLLCLPGIRAGGAFHASPDGLKIEPTYELFVIGFDGVLFFLFGTFSFLLESGGALLTSVAQRFLAVGMLSAAVAIAVLDLMPRLKLIPEGPSGGLRFFLLLLAAGTIVYGFCVSFADGMSRWFAKSLPALEAFGRGETGVLLDDSPRDETGVFAKTFNTAVAQRREAAFLERAFGRYVAPAVLDALRRNRRELKLDEGLNLPSRRLDATVLYADIRGFTRFSESESPEEVMRVLNVYFERMIDVIGRHEGYINKFIGDAVMVVFGAPVEQPDHAARAVRCAAAMQETLAGMNASNAFGAGRVVEIGIGVNTGALVAGSLGSDARAEYTVIGDTVNVAARLTSAAKPGDILIGSATASACGASGLEPQPPLTVKGKSQPLEVFRLAVPTKAAATA